MKWSQPLDQSSKVSLLVKYLLFSCNVLFWVLSIALVAAGSWSIATKMAEGSRRMTSAWDFAFDAAVIFIIIGIIAFILASAGCIGALRENVVLLKFFWIVLLLIFAVFLLTGIIGFASWSKLHASAENKLSVKVIKRYLDDSDLNDFMDFIQEKFKCCGLSDRGFHDWNMNLYFNCTEKNHDPRRCGVPHSCCLPKIRYIDGNLRNFHCGFGMQLKTYSEAVEFIYTNGCIEQVVASIRKNILTICSVSLALSLIPLFNVCLAVTLIDQIKAQAEVWMDLSRRNPLYIVGHTRF